MRYFEEKKKCEDELEISPFFCYEYKTQKILENVQMKVWLTPSMSPLLCYDARALCLWENDCWVDFFQILYCCCAYSFLLPLFCSERRIKKNYTLKTGIMMSSQAYTEDTKKLNKTTAFPLTFVPFFFFNKSFLFFLIRFIDLII